MPERERRVEIPKELTSSGKFEVLGLLGQGGMGSVYKARRPLLDDVVAIKLMSPAVAGHSELRSRFLREMRATGKLNHRRIVRALDAEQVGESLLLVMEYVEGVSLDRLVKQKGPLPVGLACRLVAQAAEGLQHAHELGMVHRDVKPANLMLTAKDWEVKILDFGLVQVPKGEGNRLGQTQSQTFMGTPEYVAPEQALDAAKADIRSDVYALGCTLYFLLAGEPPFRRDSAMETILAHVQQEPSSLSELRPEVPAGLSMVVARMLVKKPADRYQTPGEVAAALAPFVGTAREKKATKAPPPVPVASEATEVVPEELVIAPKVGSRRRKKSKGSKGLLIGGGVGLTLAVVLVGWLMLGSEPKAKSGKVGKQSSEPVGKQVQARKSDESTAKEVVNSIGMRLILIRGGEFTMGSPEGEVDRASGDPEKQHRVRVSEFYLGVYEVTQKEFRSVMGYNPSHFSRNARGKPGVDYVWEPGDGERKVPAGDDTEKYPVENVTWEEAKEFCEKLNARVGDRIPAGWVYRLPREAEWEYACRGGAVPYQVFHFGDVLNDSRTQANFDGNFPYGSTDPSEYYNRPGEVGSYPKNRFGLYDTHGNVWEWCADWYDPDYYTESEVENPTGPVSRSSRVFRGGGWGSGGKNCRSAHRNWFGPTDQSNFLGFRVALVPASRGKME